MSDKPLKTFVTLNEIIIIDISKLKAENFMLLIKGEYNGVSRTKK
tara:strand:- start:688 stop:822 length:135 start_codon:yes stop_codon:yes gene_type:complete